MPKRTVSEAYLMGIRDERRLYKILQAEGADMRVEARSLLTNIKATLAEGFSGEMAEYMRGSRDFWANQVRRGL